MILMTDRVLIAIENGVADVRLNRPDKMNAIDPAMLDGIEAALDTLKARTDVRAVVLSGEGRAFCAGMDMATLAGFASSGLDGMSRTHGPANIFQHVAWGWRQLPMPVIGVAHGVVFGAGTQILSGADIRIARPDARLSIMEMKWGLVPDMAGLALWRTLVRDDVLRELIYTRREITGDQAARLGLVTRTAEDPLKAALDLAHEIAANSPSAVRAAKRLVNAAADLDAPAILLEESREQVALIAGPHQMEAVMANIQKRQPEFKD